MISRRVLFSTVGLGAMSFATAAAADPIIMDTVAFYPYSISGYVELRIGFEFGDANGTYNSGLESWDETWQGWVFGGAGRAATMFTSDFSVQGDAWFNGWFGNYSGTDTGTGPFTGDYEDIEGGIAGHLSWRPDSRTLVGGFASLGGVSGWGLFGTAGLEGAIGDEMWRAYGQVGVTGALSSEAAGEDVLDFYARGVLAYYLDPNLSVSANLGIDAYSDNTDGGTTGTGVTWGARLEYKPAEMPFTGFVAYQGWGWSASGATRTREAIDHAILVGLRMPFGADGATTLRAMDDEVGLYDMNAIYGEPFVR